MAEQHEPSVWSTNWWFHSVLVFLMRVNCSRVSKHVQAHETLYFIGKSFTAMIVHPMKLKVFSAMKNIDQAFSTRAKLALPVMVS